MGGPVAAADAFIYTVVQAEVAEGTAMLIALLIPVTLAMILFSFVLLRAAIAQRAKPNGEALVVGAIVNFFDTLGIGSFAPPRRGSSSASSYRTGCFRKRCSSG